MSPLKICQNFLIKSSPNLFNQSWITWERDRNTPFTRSIRTDIGYCPPKIFHGTHPPLKSNYTETLWQFNSIIYPDIEPHLP